MVPTHSKVKKLKSSHLEDSSKSIAWRKASLAIPDSFKGYGKFKKLIIDLELLLNIRR